MVWTSRLSILAVVVGTILIGLAVALPWAYVDGHPVGLDWVGVQAAVPALLLGLATISAIVARRRRRWAVLAATGVGLFAIYASVALARAIPTMAAVWADGEGIRGPALLAIIGAEAALVLAAWSTLLFSRDSQQR